MRPCGLQCSHCIRPFFRFRFQRAPFWVSNLRSIVKYVAILCLLLTFWSAVAFAAHHHSNRTEAAKCTVCVAAHSAALKATASLLKAKFTPISTFLPEPVFVAQTCVASRSAFARLPPSSCLEDGSIVLNPLSILREEFMLASYVKSRSAAFLPFRLFPQLGPQLIV